MHVLALHGGGRVQMQQKAFTSEESLGGRQVHMYVLYV